MQDNYSPRTVLSHDIEFLLVPPVVVGDIITTTVSFAAPVILVHFVLLRLELKVTMNHQYMHDLFSHVVRIA